MAVRLSESEVTLKVGETVTLQASVEPAIADYDRVAWSSSNPSVATVTDGVVQVLGVGTTNIIASAGGVVSRACTITVEEPVVEPSVGIQAEETEIIPEVSEEVEVTEELTEETVGEVEVEGTEETVEVETEGETEMADVMGECFIYDVDFGEKGSYIDIDSLVTVFDWRGRNFNDYPSYWDYYGPFEITIDVNGAECDLNGERQSLPQSVILIQTEPGETSVKDPDSGETVTLPANRHGFLMRKFSTVGLTQPFNIYVKARIKYGFGTIQTDWITIPVVIDPSI